MHVRVADSASDREAKRRLEEEAEVADKTIRKLKERQEALVAAPSKDMSATEWQMKEERDKLLVSHSWSNVQISTTVSYADYCRNYSAVHAASRTSSSKSSPSVCTVSHFSYPPASTPLQYSADASQPSARTVSTAG